MTQRGRIQPLRGSSGTPLSVTFESEEVAAIEDMLGYFGDTREDIVFKAISLLYTIYQQDPKAESVFIQKGNQRIVIPLK
ncbi:MAG: hypothetical protein HYZ49_01110 [Chloroflexi bacterium]|nr:hypothetical protein [Chloroflexota bacterium]